MPQSSTPDAVAEPIMISGYRCGVCFTTAYSRAFNDRRFCTCTATVVNDGPLNPRLVASPEQGAQLVQFESPGTLEQLLEDYNYAHGMRQFRIKAMPASALRYVGDDLFPIRASRAAPVDGEDLMLEARLMLVAPRNIPQGALGIPSARSPDGNKFLIWVKDGQVWGRVSYTISNITDEDNPIVLNEQLARMPLCEVDALSAMVPGQIREFRTAWSDIMDRYLDEVPGWWERPAIVDELVWVDILSYTSSSTANAYNRNLEAQRRFGRLLPSIFVPKAQEAVKKKATKKKATKKKLTKKKVKKTARATKVA